jgi:hypothetical protein
VTPSVKASGASKKAPHDYLSKARLKDKAGDWAYAQAEYEAGIKTVRDIALDIGVTESAVHAHISKGGWIRDPHARLRVQEELRAAEAEKFRAELAAKKDMVVRVTAQMQSSVMVRHRADIHSAQTLVKKLLKELSEITDGIEEFDNLGELMHSPDARGMDRLNAAYRRVISLPERSGTLSSLASVLKTLIQLERQAFGITGALEDPEQARAPEEVVQGLDKIDKAFSEVMARLAPPAEVPLIVDVAPSKKELA